ncbi:hypothetical protein ASA1KI_35030 [Opitutales bacterium ASA1]|uniref:hypothetical protein n=1 Tax=Congregicoccus parvus TaxID=3081749 RepID=UPI002B3163B3|nr:hypothetical protein ASA1KI_35030 [Opitutales bacterium ASA1]
MRAAALVAGTYVYFLVFAQFAFLAGVESEAIGRDWSQYVLGAMALAGFTGSVVAYVGVVRMGPVAVLRIGAIVAATAAGAAATCFGGAVSTTPMFLAGVAAAAGLGLACVTVSVASILGRLVEGGNPGLHVGVGTAIAYVVANVPWVFHASPAVQSVFAAFVIALLVVVTAFISPATVEVSRGAKPWRRRTGSGFRRIAGATVVFLALVWFDSAAFAAVQQDPVLRGRFWGDASTLWANGMWHALGAIAAGWALSRGLLRVVWISSIAGLLWGAWGFWIEGAPPAAAAPIYVVSVSAYSTALAAYAALRSGGADTVGAARSAACVYGIAGWVGSTAGIGLVLQHGGLPDWAAWVAAAVFVLGILWGWIRVEDAGETRCSA